MRKSEFHDRLRQLLHCEAFSPFAVELRDGSRIVVERPPVVFCDGAASFIDPADGALVDFFHDQVKGFVVLAQGNRDVNNREVAVIADLVVANRKPLAHYIRQKLIAAGAKPYLDKLGKEGIETLEKEAAGLVLEIGCALLRRLTPASEYEAETVLHALPTDIQNLTRLPRSESYHAVTDQLHKSQGG